MKRLYRSKKNRILCGVCAGIAEYYKIDPTVVRLFFILFTLLTGFLVGIIFYIIACLIIPEKE